MYNAEIKMQYIQYCTEHKNVRAEKFLPLLFDKTAPFEQNLGKDLYEFTVREITDMYQSLFTASYSSLMNIHSHLRDYTNYCNVRNLLADGINHYNELDAASVRRCLHEGLKREQIISREDLIDMLKTNDIRNAFEKTWILGTFEGLTGKAGNDLLYLTRDRIDFDKKIVHLPESGRVLTISDELAALMLETLDETSYATSGDSIRKFSNPDPNVLFKPSSNGRSEFASKSFARRMLLSYSQQLDYPYLNTYALKTSGIIDYIKRLMKSDGVTSPLAAYKLHREEIEMRYGAITSTYHFELYADEYMQ